ncbi:MAG: cob(I)yrinic acid a,c-diamide adenosyltransferase [Clostridiales bacterium]|jgi:cob(I)alamin adenosyltransferase|nr:cob(I)yrinic acid a,c-diamide adenosyltransferase [Clostridiales bacterium]
MNIYTKTGDCGETGLLNGRRVAKDDIRICLVGEIDELNAHLGLIKIRTDAVAEITEIQKNLMRIMAGFSDIGNPKFFLAETAVAALEKQADALQALMPNPLGSGFVLPGENETAAMIDIARTVARRAERTLTAANRDYPIDGMAKKYLNRLSDYLFLLARHDGLVAKIAHGVRRTLGRHAKGKHRRKDRWRARRQRRNRQRRHRTRAIREGVFRTCITVDFLHNLEVSAEKVR